MACVQYTAGTGTETKTNWGLLIGFVALIAIGIVIFGEK